MAGLAFLLRASCINALKRSSLEGPEVQTRGDKGTTEIRVWTIGHGRRSAEEFLKLLRTHDNQTLVDVRRFPTSKVEHFKGEVMSGWLQREGISYVWLGRELGGYRSGGYKKHMRSRLFASGIKALLELAEDKNACIMCLEVNPNYCHRRFISEYLEKRGIRVVHIL